MASKKKGGGSRKGTSRARAKPERKSVVAERVARITAMMASGEYDGYTTRAELAKEWGLSDDQIRKYTAEASRRLTLDPEELEQQKLVHAAWAERIRREALETVNSQTGMRDFTAALKANMDAAKFRGIDVESARKVELTGKDGESLGLAELFARLGDDGGGKSGAPAAPAG